MKIINNQKTQLKIIPSGDDYDRKKISLKQFKHNREALLKMEFLFS